MSETQAFIDATQQLFTQTGSWDLGAMEQGLREALLNDGCRILRALLNQPNALGDHKPSGKLHDTRKRTVKSLLGSFELSRGYYQTEEGWFCPMDRLLGLTDSYSPGLTKMMCRAAGTDGSFCDAEDTLRVYAGVHVPASQIRDMVQQIGPDLEKWSFSRQEVRNEKVSKMYISYDGTGVPMRKEETAGRKGKQPDGTSGSREVKLGCVFTSQAVDAEGCPVRDPGSTTYIASFKPAEEFGAAMLQEARLRGLGKAEQAVVIGDGAHWIWNQAAINFPQAKQILDFYHAREHLSVLAKALFPVGEKSLEQVAQWLPWLENDQVLKIADDAEKKRPHHGPRRKEATREIEYFRTNKHRMMYATFKKEGFFIGSGVIEAGCKTVVGKRTKQSGMFWRVKGAQNVLHVRCAVIGNFYDEFWEYRKKKGIEKLLAVA